MAYEVIILGHLHMPLYFLETFTEYPYINCFGIIIFVSVYTFSLFDKLFMIDSKMCLFVSAFGASATNEVTCWFL